MLSREKLRSLSRECLDLVFSSRCPGCGRHLSAAAGDLCGECARKAPFPQLACAGCGRGAVDDPRSFCRSCEGRFHRDGLLVSAVFAGPQRDLVHAFKYRGDLQAGRCLGSRLAGRVRRRLSGFGEVVVPVPLHPRRLRERGFNQASQIARILSRETGLPVVPRALMRKIDTRPLTGLSRRDRAAELRGTIFVRKPRAVSGREVVLVDDVVTTGATAEECCRALKKEGAASVVVVAAARA